MKVTISFKHLEHTPALDEKIHEKSSKLAKYMGDKTNLKWTCYVKDGLHYADVQMLGPTFEYHAHAFSDNLYKTFDLAVGKLEKQVSKRKDKWKDHMNKRNIGTSKVEILEPEVAWTDYDEDKFDDVA